MQTTRPIIRRMLAPLRLLALLFVACHLGQETRVEDTLSFTKQYDSLSRFDTVRIEARDESGRTLAIIYQGKVDTLKEIQNLSVPGWDGGPLTLVISGYAAGNPNPIYQEEKKFDGSNPKTTTQVLIHPNPGLSSASLLIQLPEGKSIPMPQVDIYPANLAQSTLEWSSSNPQVARIADGKLWAESIGGAQLTVKLAAYPSKTLVFEVVVQADPTVPETIILDRDTLYLAENGAPRSFGIAVYPTFASAEVQWTLKDSTVAALRSDGYFQGLKPGSTVAIAASKAKASVRDSGVIVVSEPVPVASVRFLKETITLYVGGAGERLSVEVLPEKANSEVAFTLSDPLKAKLSGDTLLPLAEGSLTVIVRSKEDTGKVDTLTVAIEVPVPILRVEASDSAFTLYVRGESKTVKAKAYPDNAPQGVRWTSLSPTVATVGEATGMVQPLIPGLALVVAISQGDVTKRDTVKVSVKQDAPILSVGKDTAVSAGQTVTFLPTVTQEYGQVVMYRWDLDGDLRWDDSAGAIAPKSFRYDQPRDYTARFYVRDTEGNETVQSRRISVVSGVAVLITSPPDNFHTNRKVVTVAWSVNDKSQDKDTSHTLSAVGPNTITRSARDSAGKEYSHSITVHFDTTAPVKPNLSGTSPTNVKPRWAWSSGGGGYGEYRIRLGDDAFPTGAPTTRDTVNTLSSDPVSGTTYTLFVQERDLAGNWSPSASLAIVYNVTQPVVVIQAPRASGTHYTSLPSVALNGTATGPVAISKVTYKAGSAAAQNATFAAGAWSTPALTLQEDVALLVTLTATDIAGNTGEASLTLFHDLTPPTAPTILTGPTGNVADLKASFTWSPGGDGASGSGLNGRYRFNLNNGPWKDTAATLLTDLPLPEGNVVFNVQAQDRALNWSTAASRAFKADITPPTITLTSHANPYSATGLSITLAGQVLDTISGVASMTVSGQASRSGTVTVNAMGTWTTAALALVPGANTLIMSALDQAGNSRTLNAVVNVTIPASTVIITSPPNNHLTQTDTVIVQYTINGVAGNRSFGLTEGFNSLVVESPPNQSGLIGRDTVIVRRDATPPNPPTVTPTASPTRTTATWTWTSNGDNSGGAGLRTPASWRYQVNGGAWTPAATARLDIATEGTHSVVVQEQDRAGNWSANSTTHTIVVDKTGPTITFITSNNYVTNKATVPIRYRVGSVEATPTDCLLSRKNEAHSCQVTASDELGNPTTASITVHYRPDTYFITPDGIGDGSSWDSPTRDLRGLAGDWNLDDKEFWVASGNYGYVNPKFSMTILGGFDASAKPYQTTGRNKLGTVIAEMLADFTGTVTLDGVRFTGSLWVRICTMNLIDATFDSDPGLDDAIRAIDGGILNATNVVVTDNTYNQGVVYVGGGSSMTFIGGSVVGNNSGEGYPFAVSGNLRLSTGFSLNSNTTTTGYQMGVYDGSTVTVDMGVNFDCREIHRDGGGSGTCKGNPF